MVSDGNLFVDSKQVIVPPVRQFLAVRWKPDREQYQPREEGTFSITTTDVDGRPVAAEIALGLIDQSVNYIQSDYAGDPRQFYYGNKRGQMVQTQSTFNQKSYARMVDIGEGQLRDQKDVNEAEKQRGERFGNGPINGRLDDRERASGTLQALSPGVAGWLLTQFQSLTELSDL
jgi:hypothetical protein